MKFKEIELKEGLIIREGQELHTHYLEILPVKYIQQIFISRIQRKELLKWVYALLAFGVLSLFGILYGGEVRKELWASPVICFLGAVGVYAYYLATLKLKLSISFSGGQRFAYAYPLKDEDYIQLQEFVTKLGMEIKASA